MKLPCLLAVTMVMLSTAACATLVIASPADEPRWPGATPDLVGRIRNTTKIDLLHRSHEHLRTEPLFIRLSIAKFLIHELKNDAIVATPDYEPSEDRHDLTVVAGRAAWMLEAAVGCNLPAISSTTAPPELERYKRSAHLQVKAYERGVRETRTTYVQQPTIEQLAVRYRADLTPELQLAPMVQLLTEWYPLGKRLEDLERALDRSARKVRIFSNKNDTAPTTGPFVLEHDDGFGGFQFVLNVESGVIVSVHYRYLD